MSVLPEPPANEPAAASTDRPSVAAVPDLVGRGDVSDLVLRLELALEAGALGTWQWDRATDTVVWDSRLHRIFGLALGTFDGTFDAWLGAIHPDDRASVMASVEEAMETGAAYDIEHRAIRPDGVERWVHGRGVVTVDSQGEALGTIGCAADITDRKQAELAAEQALAIAAQLATHERAQRERFAFLAQLTDAALAARDARDYLRAVVAAAVPTLGDWCVLHFRPSDGDAPAVAVGHRDPAKVAWAHEFLRLHPFDPDGASALADVMRTGTIQFVDEIGPELIELALSTSSLPRDEARAVLDMLEPRSMISVPLLSTTGIVGAARFVMAESGRRYHDDDVALARAAAGRIAGGLEVLWRADQQRHIAATLQAALLPPALPDIDGVEVAVRYWAAGASDVGGDFYDVFAVEDERWAILIGDVCGTGPDAAAVTSIARHTVRAAARHGHDHREVLRWLNEAVLLSNRGLFATCCYATLERQVTGGLALRAASGGHPRPIVVDRFGAVRLVETKGTLLGVFERIKSGSAEVFLEPGDTVVFYTDGVTDVPAPHGLTDDEFADAVRLAASAGSADAIVEALRGAIERRQPIAQRTDDIALVVLHVR